MRIAVIGAGISGLVAARGLAREHEVVLLESERRIGGHTHTVPVTSGGRTWNVDLGFIVFNEPNYPRFSALLRELGVPSRPTSMSFSVRSERTGVEYNGASLDGLFAQRANLVRPSFLRMIADILRFNREAPSVLDDPAERATTVDAWVRRRNFSRAFRADHLMPLGASLWSCSPGTFATFPMRFFVTFLKHHGMLAVGGRPQWRTVVGGSSAYIGPLVAPFAGGIRAGAAVAGIRRDSGGVTLRFADGSCEVFDHVVVACHADQALALLDDPSPAESAILGAIRYQRNDVVLHTDISLLPWQRRAWASWNYLVTAEGSASATITYAMNILQGLDAADTFCVTLNQSARIDPRRVLHRRTFEHPLFDLASERARTRRNELVYENRTSFCGAYWGFGFHEDGVKSAHDVVDSFALLPVP